MATQLEYIALSDDRDRTWTRLKGADLDAAEIVVKQDVLHFVLREAGDLDRRVGQDQFLEFELQLAEIPLAFLT